MTDLLNHPFRFYLRKHARLVACGLVSLFMTNLMDTLVPHIVSRTIDRIAQSASLHDIGGFIGILFIIVFFTALFRYLWRYFWANFHHTVAEDLRNRLFSHMAYLGPTFFRPRKIGQLISLISNDVNSFRMGVGPGLLILFDGISSVALILPFMLSISVAWTLKTLVLMPLVPFVVHWLLLRLHAGFHSRQERYADFAGSAQEIVSGIRVIKSFAQERNQVSQFNIHSGAFRRASDQVMRWDSLFGPAMELPVALGSVILLLFGADDVIRGTVSVGQFVAFYLYIQRIIGPMSGIGVAMGHIQEGRASFRRIREVLESKPDVPDNGTEEVETLESLEVRELTFRYPGTDHDVLRGISFHLKKGECLGIVGMTGSGKSTLIELLVRQYPVAPRTIFINGIPVENIRLSCLRRLIGLVPQDAFLFSRKISENLALGLDQWEMEDVREAAGHVRLDREIETWPSGYEALVGERGVNLSGGQKQRMTLARALIRDAPLVILDDSLSAVDAKTEETILSYLRGHLKRTTSIIVSHRLASVRAADQILVLAGGEVESAGQHADLLRTSATYRAIHQMQFEVRAPV